jgi:CheY-like chemotaxis protein
MSEDHARPVLLVEDNADDAELAIRGLKRANLQNQVDVARDGQQAFEYLFGTGEHVPKRVPSVVLLDLKLPRIDGLEVLNRIRAEERTRLVPVVILTSSSEDRDLINAYHLWANGYVIKPIQFDEFTDAIEHLGLYWLTTNQPAPSADDDTPAANNFKAQHSPATGQTRADPNAVADQTQHRRQATH